MWMTAELYLIKKNISKDEWFELIKIISSYNGFFRSWKIVVINDKNQIRYFVKTKCSLPATINRLNSFLLKPVKEIRSPKYNYMLYSFFKFNSNVIDLINYS